MTQFLLDSGDPDEQKEISQLARAHNQEIWGATTNPSLIAKKLAGKKFTPIEAFRLQKEIVLAILSILPGAVSAEVYADATTKAHEMIEQGREIASWHSRVVVKLPTTIEGFKARSVLRKENISINNTLVFSQQQIFAICMHEKLVQQAYSLEKKGCPPFISPFIGRLDDQNQNGLSVIENGLRLKNSYFNTEIAWILVSSIRNSYHVKQSMKLNAEIITAPAKVYREWFALSDEQKELLHSSSETLSEIPAWNPTKEQLEISSLEEFIDHIHEGSLDISHPLTEKGIEKFTQDWHSILA